MCREQRSSESESDLTALLFRHSPFDLLSPETFPPHYTFLSRLVLWSTILQASCVYVCSAPVQVPSLCACPLPPATLRVSALLRSIEPILAPPTISWTSVSHLLDISLLPVLTMADGKKDIPSSFEEMIHAGIVSVRGPAVGLR